MAKAMRAQEDQLVLKDMASQLVMSVVCSNDNDANLLVSLG